MNREDWGFFDGKPGDLGTGSVRLLADCGELLGLKNVFLLLGMHQSGLKIFLIGILERIRDEKFFDGDYFY